jgi:hypothetical protein
MPQSFLDVLTQNLLTPFIKKGMFTQPHVPFQSYLGCYEMALETGAVLGHAFRNNLPAFVKLFCQPGRENELTKALTETARQHVEGVGPTDSFIKLGMDSEEQRIRKMWKDGGCSQSQADQMAHGFKMEIKQAYNQIHFALSLGIALGGTMPGLAERLWNAAYTSNIDGAEWNKWRAAGLKVGAEVPKAIPLDERESQLLPMVRDFATACRPDVLRELNAVLAI